MTLKIEINQETSGNYKAVIYTGPDGIDGADFICSSLGECFEELNNFILMNSLTYSDDPKELIKSYFKSISCHL